MDKRVLIGVVVIVLLAGLGVIFVNPFKQTPPNSTSTQSEGNNQTNSSAGGNESTNTGQPVGSTNSAVMADEVVVEIKNFKFEPANLTVKKGTTVTWINQDGAKHNAAVTSGEGPKGPLLAKGEKYSYTFDKVGSFPYVCDPHASFMKATITVTE